MMGEVSSEKPTSISDIQSSYFCLICNAKIGSNLRRGTSIFSERAFTSYRKVPLHVAIGSIINEDLNLLDICSTVICKKCLHLVENVDSLEFQLTNCKEEINEKYKLTNLNSEEVLANSDDGLAASPVMSATADDDDFDPHVADKKQLKRRKRGKSRGKNKFRNTVKLKEDFTREIKEEKEYNEDIIDDVLVKEHEFDGAEVCIDSANSSSECHYITDVEQTIIEVSGLDVIEELAVEVGDFSFLTLNGLYSSDIRKKENSSNDPSFKGRFVCRYCSMQQRTVEEIRLHIEKSHTQIMFDCEVCSEFFPDKVALIIHLKEHMSSEKKAFTCGSCHKSFALPRQLQLHRQSVHSDKYFSCSLCSKLFKSEEVFAEHANAHCGIKPFSCTQCSKSFAARHSARLHIRTHGGVVDGHKCIKCGKEFVSSYHLSVHMNEHLMEKCFICQYCGKAFSTNRNLEQHRITHTGVKSFKCKYCSKAFARKAEIKDHERIHTGEKPFQCEICGSMFTQRSNLQSHMKATHLDMKNFTCEICNKSFKRNRLLNYHKMSVHTGEKPYKCTHCTAAFVYPEHYKKHLRIHTGEKPYKCDVCGKAFNNRDNRNHHLFIHSERKLYQCTLCSASFMRKPLIINHLQQHGQEENAEEYIKVNNPLIGSYFLEKTSDSSVHSLKIDDDLKKLTTKNDVYTNQTTMDVDSRTIVEEEEEDPLRQDENFVQLLSNLQNGQIVHLRPEDLDSYTTLSNDQGVQISVTTGTAINSTVFHPLHIYDSNGREVSFQNPVSPQQIVSDHIQPLILTSIKRSNENSDQRTRNNGSQQF